MAGPHFPYNLLIPFGTHSFASPILKLPPGRKNDVVFSGAGGKIGNSNSTSGINDGNSGNSGGSGNKGISGKLISTFTATDGGSGKFNKSGKSILTGWKLNSGRTISNHKSMFVRSIVILGNLKFGI